MVSLPFLSRRFAVAALLLILAAFIQMSGIAAVSGVKPNILLVVLSILAFFFRDWSAYVGLLAVVALFSRSESGFNAPYLALAGIAFLLFFIKQRLPGNQIVNMGLAIGGGTVLTYLLIDFTFLANDPFTVLIEVIYNVLVGIVVYLIAERLIGHETEFRASR